MPEKIPWGLHPEVEESWNALNEEINSWSGDLRFVGSCGPSWGYWLLRGINKHEYIFVILYTVRSIDRRVSGVYYQSILPLSIYFYFPLCVEIVDHLDSLQKSKWSDTTFNGYSNKHKQDKLRNCQSNKEGEMSAKKLSQLNANTPVSLRPWITWNGKFASSWWLHGNAGFILGDSWPFRLVRSSGANF